MDAALPSERVVEFAGYLREHGYVIGMAETSLLLQLTAHVGPQGWRRLEQGWRAVACANQQQWERFSDLFGAFWFPDRVRLATRSSMQPRKGKTLPQLMAERQGSGDAPPSGTAAQIGVAGDGNAETSGENQAAQGGASRAHPFEQRDFATMTEAEHAELDRCVDALRERLRKRRLRRQRVAPHGKRISLRETMRAALGTGGEMVRLVLREQRKVPHKVFVLVDVSRSMESHAHFFLRVARALCEGMRARVFVFHTQLAEITSLMEKRSRYIQDKINSVNFGFGGGTRIGSNLQSFLDHHARRDINTGDLVLILSDGYDTDAPDLMAAALRQMRGKGARIVWLHPSPQAPQSAAMDAGRAYIHSFFPAHDVQSLMALPDQLY